MNPAQGLQQLQMAVGHHQAGRLEEAERLYRVLRTTLPKNFDVWLLSGTAALQRREFDVARDHLQKAQRIDPRNALCALRYGMTYSFAGRHAEALPHFKNSLRLDPKQSEGWSNIAQCQRATGDVAGAKESYQKALSLNPNYAEAHDLLGSLVADTEGLAKGLPHFKKAVALQPKLASAWCNLGLALCHVAEFSEANRAFEKVLSLDPRMAKAWVGLGLVQLALYQLKQAAESFGIAIALNPKDAEAHSGRLLSLHYLEDQTPGTRFAEHEAFGKQFDVVPAVPVAKGFWDGTRALRVAILSPDLRRHSVAYFLEPLLRHLEGTRFEIHLFHDHAIVDDISERLKGLARHWTPLAGQTDAVVETRIRQYAPDVIFDLAGHTGINRLRLFAHRLAPVQISYLGYPDTTGLRSMDFRFTDAYCDPAPQADVLHTEKLVRFSNVAWAYTAPTDAPEPVMTPADGPVVFGCFNNFAKVSDQTLRLWARILSQVDGSVLQLKGHDLTKPEIKSGIERRAAACGVDPSRIQLLGRHPGIAGHLGHYAGVDVALDPFPYHGTTTTCEALWMGVPVVTLVGNAHVSRVSGSLLQSAGHGKWATTTEDDYVATAVGLARDRGLRTQLRAGLREDLRRSPLMDHAGQSGKWADAILRCVAEKNV